MGNPLTHDINMLGPRRLPETIVRCVQIVKFIRKPANGILVNADLLARLQHSR